MSATPETPRVQTHVQVMFFDTDCAAVVHNIAYLRFIETARTLLAEQLGWGLADMARSQQYPVVVRTEIDYKAPAALGDRLRIDGWLESIERSRFWCAFHIVREDDSAILVRSRQMLALIQMPQGRPLRLPGDWQTRFAHLVKRGSARPASSGAPSRASLRAPASRAAARRVPKKLSPPAESSERMDR